MKKIYALLFLPTLSFAQDVAAIPADPVWLSHLVSQIPGGQSSLVVVLAGIVDMAFRLIKTDSPKSLIYGVANVFKLLGQGFTKLGELSDKILPQRVQGA